MLNLAICAYCRNQYTHECSTVCTPEGKYRFLEPIPLEEWELPPELPPFRKLVTFTAYEKLALIYLALHYTQAEQLKSSA